MDYLSQIEGPTSSAFGTGLYEFGYATENLPPAQAATNASQYESGGSGWDFSSTVADITKAWLSVEAAKASRPELPVQYRTNAQGQLYATDPAYRPGINTLGGVGSAVGGIPTAWLVIGAVIFVALTLGKD